MAVNYNTSQETVWTGTSLTESRSTPTHESDDTDDNASVTFEATVDQLVIISIIFLIFICICICLAIVIRKKYCRNQREEPTAPPTNNNNNNNNTIINNKSNGNNYGVVQPKVQLQLQANPCINNFNNISINGMNRNNSPSPSPSPVPYNTGSLGGEVAVSPVTPVSNVSQIVKRGNF